MSINGGCRGANEVVVAGGVVGTGPRSVKARKTGPGRDEAAAEEYCRCGIKS